jgi:hypothetical protein
MIANYFVIVTLHIIVRLFSSKTLETIYRKGIKGAICVLLSSKAASGVAVIWF